MVDTPQALRESLPGTVVEVLARPQREALDALRTNPPGNHFLGTAHTLANFETAFYRSDTADNNSFEQWLEDGSLDAAQRANRIWKRMLREYEAPPIDDAVDEALLVGSVQAVADLRDDP